MADVLSQTEVESLLAALDPGTRTAGSNPAAPRRPEDDAARVSVYDFKRPERVGKEQMRAFQAMHEGFGREFGAGLGGMLRTIIEVKLIGVDQLTYGEFVFSLENPTCFNLLRSRGLEGNLILDLSPSILFPIVDRLLGGRDPRQTVPSRPLTDIEKRLVSRVTDLAVRSLDNAWANLCQLGLQVAQVESNPQLVQIVPPNEVIVLVSFEITMGEMRGIMNLCIPFNTIEPLIGKLSSSPWAACTKGVADPRQTLSLQTSIGQAKVEMVVHLASTTISAGDLADLAIGDVIVTDAPVTQGLSVMVENRPMFLGSPGAYKGHKAVQIGRKVTRPRDIVEQKLKGAGDAVRRGG